MSTKLNAGIAFGTPIKFSGRDGIYVEFIPENHNQHKLLINWGDHPYFTQQPIHAFSVVREVAQPIADERDELLVFVERAIKVMERTANDTLDGRNAAIDGRELLSKYKQP